MSASTAKLNGDVTESQKFHLIIFRDSASEILLSHDRGGFSLPQIAIPTGQRIARCVTDKVLDTWDLRTICLFQLGGHNGLHTGADQYVVLEPRDLGWKPPAELSWVSHDKARTALNSTNQSDALKAALGCVDARHSHDLPGPFARAGWLDELLSWAQEAAHSRGLNLTGQFRQFTGDPNFSLIRIETNGPALWFKAVGEPNLHEYSITLGLAQEHPCYFPTIIAAKPEWNGWLMLEVEGKGLDNKANLLEWLRVAESLARLQIEYVERTERLLEIGCKDRRIASVVQLIDPFLKVTAQLMREQPSEPPPRLGSDDIQELGNNLKEACFCMYLAGIPDSLFHGDFNPGNFRLNSSGCIFLDWAEGCLGPPFLSLEYLIASLQKTCPACINHAYHLRRAYARCWCQVASESQIFETMRLAPSLAVFWHALGLIDWRHLEKLHKNESAKYLRSLMRRLQKELRAMREPAIKSGRDTFSLEATRKEQHIHLQL